MEGVSLEMESQGSAWGKAQKPLLFYSFVLLLLLSGGVLVLRWGVPLRAMPYHKCCPAQPHQKKSTPQWHATARRQLTEPSLPSSAQDRASLSSVPASAAWSAKSKSGLHPPSPKPQDNLKPSVCSSSLELLRAGCV